MGLQGTHTSQGASVLVIDQACDNDQLLVSLSKNEAQWLSPIGWTDQQKVTLLDCRANGDTTEIDIPAEFSKDIKSGDVLVLRCSELDLEKEIIWEASEVETRHTLEAAPASTSLASGLLSRFKGSKTEVVEDTKSEAELRAEEADRAAQNYKAKMEAATEAKEAAQRKALEAAREAEAALKMEADRIAEMERAAKAFEEAERLKQDELRRVEEERRAEEARLAEEARRIEEARKREIAAKKEADRKAALERYEAALDITRDEESRLKDRLKTLQGQAKLNAENLAVQSEDLESRKGYLVSTEEAAQKRLESFEKGALKLDSVNAALAAVQSEADTLSADNEALSIRLAQADADYQQAQKEAEAAIARAETKRAELDALRTDETQLSSRLSSISEKLSSQSLASEDAASKTEKLRLKSDTAQAELAQAKIEIDALEQAQLTQAEQNQNLRLEIEATQQAIEDSQAREVSHLEAIDHLQSGGDPEALADITVEARHYESETAAPLNTAGKTNTAAIAAEKTDKSFFSRARRNFSREKDAQISIAVEDVVLDAGDAKATPVLTAGLDETPSFARRHSSSLMALGAVIGGIALLGGGLALNKSASPKLEVKSSTPAPTQVASAVTKADLPKAIDTAPSSEVIAPEATPLTIEVPKIDTVKVEAANISVETKPVLESVEAEVTLEADKGLSAVEADETPLTVKMAKAVEPTGFAFELPNMMPLETSTLPAPKKTVAPTIKKVSLEKVAPKKIEVKKPEPAKAATPKKVEPKEAVKSEPKPAEDEVNYPELTKDIQTRLFALGFYNGDINGVQTSATKEAITNFKTLFAMPNDAKITGALLTELKRAQRDQEAAQLLQAAEAEAEAQARAEAEAAIQVAETAPVVEFYDTVQAVPTQPVVTDSLPAASADIPAYVAPEPEPVQVASIPTVTEPAPTPIIEDVIVEAKMVRNASAKYPASAQRRDYFVNVDIEVAYDIDSSGRATNLRIAANDHSGRYSEAFEREAMRAIEKLRYEPKTVNGVAVDATGQKKRIVFRAE